jgi:hypothetical protein
MIHLADLCAGLLSDEGTGGRWGNIDIFGYGGQPLTGMKEGGNTD